MSHSRVTLLSSSAQSLISWSHEMRQVGGERQIIEHSYEMRIHIDQLSSQVNTPHLKGIDMQPQRLTSNCAPPFSLISPFSRKSMVKARNRQSARYTCSQVPTVYGPQGVVNRMEKCTLMGFKEPIDARCGGFTEHETQLGTIVLK